MLVIYYKGELKMFSIPEFLDKDDYLQNPIMRRFLKDRGLDFVENRADYIKAIAEYANSNQENEMDTKQWLLQVAREGSKEFCYKKIHSVGNMHKDPALVETIIKKEFPNCPMQDILTYRNTNDRNLIDYKIIIDETEEVEKITFTFSKFMLTGENGQVGDITIFPVFVEVYLNEGFVISRAKAKATVYHYVESKMLSSDNHVNTMDYAASAIDRIINVLGFEVEDDKKKVKNENSKMLYNLYQEFSFTPEDVEKKVNSMAGLSKAYIDKLFLDLGLSVTNKPKALLDISIFVEKFVSINGNNENIFKEDRDAYLIKVSADDELELTKIDTTSDKAVPLQCTDAFFDSKKSVLKGKKCNKLNLIFKRTNELYLKSKPLVVQFSTNKTYGVFKTTQYAEEADINNVLQTIFRNY